MTTNYQALTPGKQEQWLTKATSTDEQGGIRNTETGEAANQT